MGGIKKKETEAGIYGFREGNVNIKGCWGECIEECIYIMAK